MKPKLKHLRHPLRAATAAQALIAARWNMRRSADRGGRRFRDDPRYDLRNVIDGFASRLGDETEDATLLERICTAYIKAVRQQPFAPATYTATGWWEQVRQANLTPVMRALQNRDIGLVQQMYRNFFRDPCSAGLIGVPWSGASFGSAAKEVYRRFYLGDVLHRIDYWKTQTDGRFSLLDLAGPPVGNPFGALIEGTLIRAGSEYQHYCAYRISGLLDSQRATVAEIGGGFGDMAYYLFRDRARVTYLDFDLPESIALASYYLLKSFPQLTFLLYGEQELTADSIARADVVLMPAFELPAMPTASVNLTFCSHVMSDTSPEDMAEYLDNIARMTRDSFLFVGSSRAAETISRLSRGYSSFTLAETRPSDWHAHRASNWSEAECLFRVAPTVSRNRSAELVEK